MYHIKEDKRSIQSSQWIYGALTKLMKKQLYKDITITDIVKEAELGRATFYRNFDSKDDVLEYVCDNTFRGLLDCLMDYQKHHAVQYNPDFLKPFLYFFDEHTVIVEQLIQANRQDLLSKSLAKILELFLPKYKKLVANPEKTWGYFIAIRCGITINILIQWIDNGKNLSPEELSNLLMQELKRPFTVEEFL